MRRSVKRFIEAHAMITAMGEQTGDTDLFLCDVGAKLLKRVEGAAAQFNSEGEEQSAEGPLEHSRRHLRVGASFQPDRRSRVSRPAARCARTPGRCWHGLFGCWIAHLRSQAQRFRRERAPSRHIIEILGHTVSHPPRVILMRERLRGSRKETDTCGFALGR